MNAWDTISESLSILGLLGFLGLQIFCGVVYRVQVTTIACNIAAVVLIYAGFMVLQFFPELLNGTGSEPLVGKVRIYAVRMLRTVKLIIVYGVLVPSIFDGAGIDINGAYSVIVLVLIVLTIGWFLYKIWKYNKSQDKKK